MTVIVIAPSDDAESKTAAGWALGAARLLGVDVFTSRIRSAITERLQTADHVLYFGHGRDDALIAKARFWGRREPICDVENLPRNGRVVIAVACSSGRILGTSLTDGSPPRVETYLGWMDDMSWPPAEPTPIAQAILAGVKVLADGGNVEECSVAMCDGFEEAHELYRSDASGNPVSMMQATYWKERLRVQGNRNATCR